MKSRETAKLTEYWQKAKNKANHMTSTMYKEILGERVNKECHRILQSNYVRPRVQFTLWMALHEKLPTKDITLKFGITIDGICSMCPNYEMIGHLFFDCV